MGGMAWRGCYWHLTVARHRWARHATRLQQKPRCTSKDRHAFIGEKQKRGARREGVECAAGGAARGRCTPTTWLPGSPSQSLYSSCTTGLS